MRGRQAVFLLGATAIASVIGRPQSTYSYESPVPKGYSTIGGLAPPPPPEENEITTSSTPITSPDRSMSADSEKASSPSSLSRQNQNPDGSYNYDKPERQLGSGETQSRPPEMSYLPPKSQLNAETTTASTSTSQPKETSPVSERVTTSSVPPGQNQNADGSYNYDIPDKQLKIEDSKSISNEMSYLPPKTPTENNNTTAGTLSIPSDKRISSAQGNVSSQSSIPRPNQNPDGSYNYDKPERQLGSEKSQSTPPDMSYLPPKGQTAAESSTPSTSSSSPIEMTSSDSESRPSSTAAPRPNQNADGSYNYDKPSKQFESGGNGSVPAEMSYLPPKSPTENEITTSSTPVTSSDRPISTDSEKSSTPSSPPRSNQNSDGSYNYDKPQRQLGSGKSESTPPDMSYLPPKGQTAAESSTPSTSSSSSIETTSLDSESGPSTTAAPKPNQNADGSYNYDKPSKQFESGGNGSVPAEMSYLPPQSPMENEIATSSTPVTSSDRPMSTDSEKSSTPSSPPRSNQNSDGSYNYDKPQRQLESGESESTPPDMSYLPPKGQTAAESSTPSTSSSSSIETTSLDSEIVPSTTAAPKQNQNADGSYNYDKPSKQFESGGNGSVPAEMSYLPPQSPTENEIATSITPVTSSDRPMSTESEKSSTSSSSPRSNQNSDGSYNYDKPQRQLGSGESQSTPPDMSYLPPKGQTAAESSTPSTSSSSSIETTSLDSEIVPSTTAAPKQNQNADGSYNYDKPSKQFESGDSGSVPAEMSYLPPKSPMENEITTSSTPVTSSDRPMSTDLEKSSTPSSPPRSNQNSDGSYNYDKPQRQLGSGESQSTPPDMSYLPPKTQTAAESSTPSTSSSSSIETTSSDSVSGPSTTAAPKPNQNEDGSYNYDKPSKQFESGGSGSVPAEMSYLPPKSPTKNEITTCSTPVTSSDRPMSTDSEKSSTPSSYPRSNQNSDGSYNYDKPQRQLGSGESQSTPPDMSYLPPKGQTAAESSTPSTSSSSSIETSSSDSVSGPSTTAAPKPNQNADGSYNYDKPSKQFESGGSGSVPAEMSYLPPKSPTENEITTSSTPVTSSDRPISTDSEESSIPSSPPRSNQNSDGSYNYDKPQRQLGSGESQLTPPDMSYLPPKGQLAAESSTPSTSSSSSIETTSSDSVSGPSTTAAPKPNQNADGSYNYDKPSKQFEIGGSGTVPAEMSYLPPKSPMENEITTSSTPVTSSDRPMSTDSEESSTPSSPPRSNQNSDGSYYYDKPQRQLGSGESQSTPPDMSYLPPKTQKAAESSTPSTSSSSSIETTSSDSVSGPSTTAAPKPNQNADGSYNYDKPSKQFESGGSGSVPAEMSYLPPKSPMENEITTSSTPVTSSDRPMSTDSEKSSTPSSPPRSNQNSDGSYNYVNPMLGRGDYKTSFPDIMSYLPPKGVSESACTTASSPSVSFEKSTSSDSTSTSSTSPRPNQNPDGSYNYYRPKEELRSGSIKTSFADMTYLPPKDSSKSAIDMPSGLTASSKRAMSNAENISISPPSTRGSFLKKSSVSGTPNVQYLPPSLNNSYRVSPDGTYNSPNQAIKKKLSRPETSSTPNNDGSYKYNPTSVSFPPVVTPVTSFQKYLPPRKSPVGGVLGQSYSLPSKEIPTAPASNTKFFPPSQKNTIQLNTKSKSVTPSRKFGTSNVKYLLPSDKRILPPAKYLPPAGGTVTENLQSSYLLPKSSTFINSNSRFSAVAGMGLRSHDRQTYRTSLKPSAAYGLPARPAVRYLPPTGSIRSQSNLRGGIAAPSKQQPPLRAKDDGKGDYISHEAGGVIRGRYSIPLGGGRKLVISYVSDNSGYHPTLNYE